MLDERDFKTYCRKHKFPKETIDRIQTVRTSPPVRRVGGNSCSTASRYPSKKMGVTIQAESLHCELARVYELEYDDAVLEYYDQPLTFKLQYEDKNGQEKTWNHVPDFLVLRTDGVVIEECKPEDRLVKLAKRYPGRFVVDESGSWRCPPGEAQAEKLGLHYRVWTPSETSWNLQRNLRFLEDYYRDDDPIVDLDAQEEVLMLVNANPGIRLSEILKRISIAKSDTIYYLIALEKIFINLTKQVLADPNYVSVYPDRHMAEAHEICASTGTEEYPGLGSEIYLEIGEDILWKDNLFTIFNITADTILLSHENKKTHEERLIELSLATFHDLLEKGDITGSPSSNQTRKKKKIADILNRASPKDHADALRRCEVVEAYLDGIIIDSAISLRTIRDWCAKYRRGKEEYGRGYIGLITHRKKRGNRKPKISQEVLELMMLTIKQEYENNIQRSAYKVHSSIYNACNEKGLQPPSYPTVLATIKQRSGPRQTQSRKGRKAANQEEPFYREYGESLSRHGDRPFEICHIDHTEGDIELVHSEFGKNLGKPWITTVSDSSSRRIFSVVISYQKPSYIACMMALREFVRRWHRMPESIVCDQGKEFNSIAFETLLACYAVTKISRPSYKARWGSTIERTYGTINTQFLHQLDGNTKIMKNVREVTPKVNPKNHAVWTLPDLYEELQRYCYELYDTNIHSTLDISPREMFELSMEKFGHREMRFVAYDDQFRTLTLPSTNKGTVKINRLKGIKVNYIWYYCDAFKRPENAGKRVYVRYDPYNMGVAYVFVDDRWEECLSEYYNVFRYRCYSDVKYAADEINKLKRDNNRDYTGVTAGNMAKFFKTTDAKAARLKANLRDSETKLAQRKLIGFEGDKAPPSTPTHDPKKIREIIRYREPIRESVMDYKNSTQAT